MSTTPTVLIVAPQFPPGSLAGVHRARHLAKWLPANGWRPVVIRVDEREYAERLDTDLAARLPADLVQIRTGAIDARLARAFGVGDLGLRGFWPIRAAIDRAIADHRPSAVLITGFPFYPMLLAGRIRRVHGLPVVLDFQDPWVSDYGATRPALSKEGLAHRLAVLLEPKALRHASFVTGVSQQQNDDMAARYPWLDRKRMAAIPIGGDPEDFVRQPRAQVASNGEDVVELRYVGAYWPRAEPCVRQLMRGLAQLRADHPAIASRLRLLFVGTDPTASATRASPSPVAQIATEEGVADLVREQPQRAPFGQALELMASAQGLVLFGSDEPHYTASKIYPVLMSGRPYLSLFHRRSSAHEVLSQAGGGIALGFEDHQQLAGLSQAIAEALRQLVTAPECLGKADPGAYAAYTAQAIGGRFAAIFDQLAAEKA